MKIAFDLMGSETNIKDMITACRSFAKKHKDVEILLVGKQTNIQEYIKENEFTILDASDVVNPTDEPIDTLRKTDSSMYKAIEALMNNKVEGVISSGSTACYVSLCYFLLKTLMPGLKPGFMPFFPINKNKVMNIIDVGANINCNGQDLYNFAILAKIFWNKILHVENPRIGIINIGTEQTKGYQYHKDADKLLREDKNLNYLGFIEPKYAFADTIDIGVCDGYTGNILLKTAEGTLTKVKDLLVQQYKKPWNWLGALTSIGSFLSFNKAFDYKGNAGAMILGLNKPAVKIHGSSDAKQTYAGLKILYEMIKSNYIEKAKEYFNGK